MPTSPMPCVYNITTKIHFPDGKTQGYSSKYPWDYENICKELTGALLEYGNALTIEFTVTLLYNK